MSVSFFGERAWELHIPNAHLTSVFDTLWAAGQKFGLRSFGLLATDSMRLEKGYRHWKADLITEFNPFETGLNRFVRLDKDFVGKEALAQMQDAGPRRMFVSLTLDTDKAPAHAGDSIVADGNVVGTITSAALGSPDRQEPDHGFCRSGPCAHRHPPWRQDYR